MTTDSLINPPIAAILARKSTDQPGVVDAERSVTHQVELAKAYAARHGCVVDERYIFVDDGVSGAEFVKRPGLIGDEAFTAIFELSSLGITPRCAKILGQSRVCSRLLTDQLPVDSGASRAGAETAGGRVPLTSPIRAATVVSSGIGSPGFSPNRSAARTIPRTVLRSRPVPRARERRPSPAIQRRTTSL